MVNKERILEYISAFGKLREVFDTIKEEEDNA